MASPSPLIADLDFHLLEQYIVADSKRRVRMPMDAAKAYAVYQNSQGQILLDPVRVIPAWQAPAASNPVARHE